jgi:hypothetical protein
MQETLAMVPVSLTYQPAGTNKVTRPTALDWLGLTALATALVGPMAIAKAAEVAMLMYKKLSLRLSTTWAVPETKVLAAALWEPGPVEPAVTAAASVFALVAASSWEANGLAMILFPFLNN